jgi:Arc/MetJ-type ribon-helix-helix transcriptional regulator
MFSAILEKVERLERENAELRQSLNDLSRRLTTIESNKYAFDGIFDDFTFSQKLNEMIDDKINDELNSESFSEYLNEAIDDKIETVFDNETFTDCLNEAIDERIGDESNNEESFTEFINEAISTAIMKNAVDQPLVSNNNMRDRFGDDVVCVGLDRDNTPQFVSKNVVNDIISKRIGNFREHVGQNNCVELYLIGRTRVFYIESLMHFKGMIKQFDLGRIRHEEYKFFYKGCFFYGIKITNGKTIGEGRRTEAISYRVEVISYDVDADMKKGKKYDFVPRETPEQTEQRKLFLQAFEDVGIKLLCNGKPVVM